MNSADYVMWGALIAAVLGVFWWDARTKCFARKNLVVVASQFGLKLDPGSGRGGMNASGVVDGRATRFSQYTSRTPGHGQPDTWIELAMQTPASQFTFHIVQKELGRELLENLGADDVTAGDPEFDVRWHIKTNKPVVLLGMLNAELRNLMDIATAAGLSGEFRLDDGWIHYREQSDFDGPDIVARFKGLLKMMTELARAVEAAMAGANKT